MSTLVSYNKTNPYGKEENCAQFGIADIRETFTLQEILSPGEKYVFSFWVSSDSVGSLVIGDTIVQTSPVWEKHSIPFVANDKNFTFGFATVGTYYIFHPKMEFGTISTDWSPAPEDADQTIADTTNAIHADLATQNTAIISTCNEIILSALKSYVETSNYDAFKTTVESQLTLMAGEIAMNFTTTSERIENVDSDLQTEVTKWNKYISFTDEGITISAGKNAMSIRIDNDIIIFEKDGGIYGWWDGIDFHTGNIVVDVNERAQFGNFAYVPRSDGSLSFLKVRHNTGFYGSLRYGMLSLYGTYPIVENTTLVFSDISGELNGTTLTLGG